MKNFEFCYQPAKTDKDYINSRDQKKDDKLCLRLNTLLKLPWRIACSLLQFLTKLPDLDSPFPNASVADKNCNVEHTIFQ